MIFQFGPIANPLTDMSGGYYGDVQGENGGLILFISNIIKFAIVAAGLFAFINLIIAGFTYISAGSDSKKTGEAWSRIYMSLIGLVIIVGSYAIAGIVGLILFNDPSAILSPRIYGPGAQ